MERQPAEAVDEGGRWAVVLDMDGVIVDTEPLHIAIDARVCRDLGATVAEREFERYVGVRAIDMWGEVRQRYGLADSAEQLLARAARLFEQAQETGQVPPPVPGALELISSLHDRGIPLAVASSSSYSSIERVLVRLQLDGIIGVRVGGDQVNHAKPHPEIYLRAAALLGLPPERCVAVEDSAYGVAAARAAGMTCVGLHNVHSGMQDLSVASVRIDSLVGLSVERLQSLVQCGEPDAVR